MNGLPFLLLAVVAVRHYASDFLALLFAHPDIARRALFYILGGIQGVVLYAVIWSLVPRQPLWMRLSVALACAWGILEESQVAMCRIAHGIDQRVSAPMWQGLCDSFTGFSVTLVTLLFVLVLTLAWRPEWTLPRM